MTSSEKQTVLEAIENGWNDRVFIYYKQFINAEAVRPQDDDNWNKLVEELKSKVVKTEKIVTK